MAFLTALAAVLSVVAFTEPVSEEPAGGCVDGGALVPEGSLVPRQDPCHVCHCHRGQIECFWKNCGPPPELCDVMQLENRCNPSLYVCPIPASVAEAPIQAAPSILSETRRRRPAAARPQVNRRRPSQAKSAARPRVRTSNSASRSVGAIKPGQTSSQRRKPPPIEASTVLPADATAASEGGPRSRPRSRSRGSSRRRGARPAMKIVPRPRVLPLVKPANGFQPPLPDSLSAAASAGASSVRPADTYFNEELSVPPDFVMPTGRGGSALAAPDSELRLGPPIPDQASAQPPPPPAPTVRASARRRTGRRRGPSRPPAPAQASRTAVPARPPPTAHDTTEPLMSFDYDLDEEIDLSDFMFPEFGRRLRRAASAVADDDVLDVAAVRRLEAEWSARRRRRSLLPGDGNQVHGHDHHGHDPPADEEHAKTCTIMGVQYDLGEVIGVASDNCLECRCAAQAMFCSPKCCFFPVEERLARQGRQLTKGEARPHPLQAFLRP